MLKTTINIKFNSAPGEHRLEPNLHRAHHAMLVCLCKAVSDRDVAQAIADGARSVDDVARCTGAGTGCGACRESLACTVQGACPGTARSERTAFQLVPLRTYAIPA